MSNLRKNRDSRQGPVESHESNPWTPAKLFWLLLLLGMALMYANTQIVPNSEAHQTLYHHVPANKFQER